MTQPSPAAPKGIISSADLPDEAYHRLLVMGDPKDGKTYTSVSTCEGPCLVINSDDKYSLQKVKDAGFTFDMIFVDGNDPQKMFDAIVLVRKAVKEGRYRTVIWDTLSVYSRRSCIVYEDATRNAQGLSDGRRYYPQHFNHVMTVVDMLLSLDCHVIVNTHYERQTEQLIEGQAPKEGDGIVSSLPGKLRLQMAGAFQNVVWLRVDPGTETRRFVWRQKGVYGLRGRTLPKDVDSCKADIKELWAMIQKQRQEDLKK